MRKQILLKIVPAVCVLGLLAGCASTQMSNEVQYEGFLPKPDVVLVYDFAVSPDEVTLDSGISARISEAMKKQPRTEQERAIGKQLATALATNLFAEIQKLGLNAVWTNGVPPANGNTLAIQGQFISIDEGNRTERVIIGLGAGRSDVRTEIQAYDFSGGKKVLADSFEMTAQSGSQPGAIVGGQEFSANVGADAGRTAKAITRRLKYLFLEQNWIGLEAGAGDPNKPTQFDK